MQIDSLATHIPYRVYTEDFWSKWQKTKSSEISIHFNILFIKFKIDISDSRRYMTKLSLTEVKKPC